MLIKDHIIVEKLNHTTQNCSINVGLVFNLDNNDVSLNFDYIPDKFKIKQESIITYLNELTKQKQLNLEELSAIITEDLYDMAVPKSIDVTIKQTINSITTSISTNKKQPNFK